MGGVLVGVLEGMGGGVGRGRGGEGCIDRDRLGRSGITGRGSCRHNFVGQETGATEVAGMSQCSMNPAL